METLNQYSPDVRDMFASHSCLFLMDREASLGIDGHLTLADERLSLDDVVGSSGLSSSQQPFLDEIWDDLPIA